MLPLNKILCLNSNPNTKELTNVIIAFDQLHLEQMAVKVKKKISVNNVLSFNMPNIDSFGCMVASEGLRRRQKNEQIW